MDYSFDTLLLHPEIENADGATVTPIYQTSAFEHKSAEGLERLFANKQAGYCYTRLTNPTVDAFEKRITLIEGGLTSIATASGMAAIFNSIINVLKSGDEIAASPSLYGGTIDLFEDLKSFGISVNYAKDNSPKALEAVVGERTRAIFAETIGNPRLDVADIRSLSELAHKNGILLFVDNTVATAFLCRPLTLGADIVINSTSKYINGSSTAIGGVITVSKQIKISAEKYPLLKDYVKFGPMAYPAKIRATVHQHIGSAMAPQTAFLNSIGIETLSLRVERACSNAYRLAEYIASFKGVTVNYPGLEESEYHAQAAEMLGGKYGAVLTLRVGSKEKAFKLINTLKIPKTVSNIGDTKTLIIHPASTIALNSTSEQRKSAGVFDDLVRISVGIECIDDLIKDFKNAFDEIGIKE